MAVNPPTVVNQALIYYLLTVGALFAGGSGVRWWIFGLMASALVVFLVLNISYARSLARMNSAAVPWAGLRSFRRARGDRLVGRASLIGTVALTVLSSAGSLRAVHLPYLHHMPGIVTVTVVGAAFGIFVSSLVDWYWVLPRRDGVIGPPPCHHDWSGSEKILTRVWLIHRMIAAALFTLAVIAALVGLIALLGYLLPESSYNTLFISTVAVPVTIASIPLVPWFKGMITLLPVVGSSFSENVGSFIDVDKGGVLQTVLVYDVSLDKGYGVIPKDLTRGSFTVQPADAAISNTATGQRPAQCAGLTCGGWDLESPFDAPRHACDWGGERSADRGVPLTASAPQPDKTVSSSRFLILK
jgi:hypothetical protein